MRNEQKRIDESRFFEGITSVRVLIENQCRLLSDESYFNDRKIKAIYITEKRKEEQRKEFSWLKAKSEELGFDLKTVDEDFIDSNTTGSTHGGIIAECTERTLPYISGADSDLGRFLVMLDGIEDPYNFGYALRSLYAAGCDGIILTERNWMSASPVVCRSSAGASETIPIYLISSSDDASKIKEKYKIVCADLRDSVPITEADLSLPLILIVGGEKRGISRSILDLSDINVRIEYGRDFQMSLSAASAATVAAFEVLRQNKKA